MNIVLVEDSNFEKVLSEHLRKRAGRAHILKSFKDGESAVVFLKESMDSRVIPDLVLVDLNLPRLSGLDVLNTIRDNAGLHNLSVAIFTDSKDPEVQFALSELGVRNYITPDIKSFENLIADMERAGAADREAENRIWRNRRSETSDEISDSDLPVLKKMVGGEPRVLDALVIDDNEKEARLLIDSFKRSKNCSLKFHLVQSLDAALAACESTRFDVCLIALGTSAAACLEAFLSISRRHEHLPVVILSSDDDMEMAAKVVHLGAQDYLIKDPANYGELGLRSIRYAIERKRAEELAKRTVLLEKQLLREVLERAPVLMIRIDANHRIKDINTTFALAAGHTKQSVLNKDVLDVLPFLRKIDIDAIMAGTPFQKPSVHVHKIADVDMYSTYWDLFGWPMQSGLRERQEAILIAMDVSERVLLEKERDEFIAALAHDIRNPLLGEQQVIDALFGGAAGGLDNRLADAFGSLKRSNQSLLLMLSNLLDVYKTDAFARLRFEVISMPALIKEQINEIAYIAQKARVELVLNVAEEVPAISGNMMAMRRLMMNLLNNALKFAPEDSKVVIDVGKKDINLEIRVRNDGPLIPESEMAKMFEKFTDYVEESRNQRGYGMGLYICRKIVTAHKGFISCQSNRKDGTVFTVTLPL